MGTVERFEDLLAWQKARELTKSIYRVTRQGDFARDFGLTGQIQRAAVSTMSNIAEGYDRNGPAEFHHFLGIAKGSCAETLSLLYVAYDAGYIGRDTFSELRAQTDEVARVIGGLRVSQARRRKAQLTRQEQ